ncbi:MAG: serine/threonine-protein phosphatase [Caldilineae bacterium]|nr:MAG: serine/threonine-protein phosphatase [Caldilineae bacterium]
MPLGVANPRDGDGYRQVEATLYPGDMVILVTDGVVECRAGAGDLFGFERLAQVVAAGPAHSSEAMKNHILHHLQQTCNPDEYSDDVTVVVVQLREETSYVA